MYKEVSWIGASGWTREQASKQLLFMLFETNSFLESLSWLPSMMEVWAKWILSFSHCILSCLSQWQKNQTKIPMFSSVSLSPCSVYHPSSNCVVLRFLRSPLLLIILWFRAQESCYVHEYSLLHRNGTNANQSKESIGNGGAEEE